MKHLVIRPEIADALAAGHAVVALESTVISHGLPHPHNLETAAAMEAAVRGAGAIPATIGLIDGEIVAGLTASEVERLATASGVTKVSRRDFGPVIAARGLGATTVAATMMVASACGIRFFATGGIGGVHRGAQSTFDISADLVEFSLSRVAVVCAGPKAVLDIGLTLEVLETAGVPVIGFGSSQLPAFYSTDSGFTLEHWASDATGLARIARAHWDCVDHGGGLLIANPPPAESAIPRPQVEEWIATALVEADREKIRGKALTPFLLSHLAHVSGGRTLGVNKLLLVNNAKLAAEVAVAYRS
ncbi:MAG TPA: pseudouridine-5'-phosphate glycosidase [Bryobacteraceae bacterium]|jgi:pseudouridine-5'-phosphate glycosidase